MKKLILSALAALCFLSVAATAQETTTTSPYLHDSAGYNVNSVHPVHKSDVMYMMSLWRTIDLREKANLPFFAEGNEITGHIMKAVEQGAVTPYQNDSLTTPMSMDEYYKRAAPEIQIPQIDDEGAIIGYETKKEPLLPKDLYTIQIHENMIFDKERSRVYYDIQSVEIKYLNSKKGVFESMGVFKYKELASYFENTPSAKWFNPYNRGADLKLTDAFDLRLFHSRIIKFANPRDESLETMYSGKNPLWASEWIEYQLVERESGFWEY